MSKINHYLYNVLILFTDAKLKAINRIVQDHKDKPCDICIIRHGGDIYEHAIDIIMTRRREQGRNKEGATQ